MLKWIAVLVIVLIIFTMIPISSFTAFASPQKNTPVIILFKHHNQSLHATMMKSYGGEVKRNFKIIEGFSANLTSAEIDQLRKDPEVASVDPDVPIKIMDSSADLQIRADQVFAMNYTGKGVPVAILDTGIDTTNPEFYGRIIQCHSEELYTSSCLDDEGHGTGVASIAGGLGINPAFKGVSPEISFYIDKVLDATATGTLSSLIAGIDWAVSNNVKVISMSVGANPTTTQSNCDSTYPSLTSAINNAVNAGITVVAASGNLGSQGVTVPGCISNVISVGAVDNTDTIASFSGQGSSMADHGIVAPGVLICVPILGAYSFQGCGSAGTGTSASTPQVTGTIALMLETNPNLSPINIKHTLFNYACTNITTPSCSTGTIPNSVYGYGRLDALNAFNAVKLLAQSSDFSMSTASPISISARNSGNDTFSLSSLSGFSGIVTLTTITSDPSVTAVLNSTSISLNSGSVKYMGLTISSLHSGMYVVTVIGTSGSTTHFTNITVTVSSIQQTLSDALSLTDNVQALKAALTCIPPISGDWIIRSSCTLTNTATAPANVIINSGAVLTIPSGLTLTVNFTTNHLIIHSGGGVLIKLGGKIN